MSSDGSLIPGFSKNPDFDFEIRTVLGHAFSGASDIGEVLAAVSGVKDKDHDGWFTAWSGLGDRLAGQAQRAQDAGHRVSAAAAWLRAATYYGTAVNAVAALESDTELLPTFGKHRQAWDRWVDLVDLDIERVSIPYEGTALPGYLLAPTSAVPDASPRATLIAVNGSDGALPSLWSACGSGALDRGYQVLLFDGPGQQSMLFEHGIPFRPDWEAVLTPVIDWLTARPDVDQDVIAVYGISQAGYWVSRALAFDHRPAAAIVDPGVVDVATSWTGHLPKRLTGLLAEGKDEEFDKEMAIGMRFSKETARTWRFRARPYGTDSYAETIRAVQQYTVADLADRITTPLLITDPEGEQFWPGQSERLLQLTPEVSTLARFTAAEGADLHCQPLGRALSQECILDWLDERLKR